MPEASASGGKKTIGITEIRNVLCENCHIAMELTEDKVRKCPKCGGNKGELLVRFSSEDAKDLLSQRYEAERVRYCMRHRRDKLPNYLRTGESPPKGKEREAKRLRLKNLLRR